MHDDHLRLETRRLAQLNWSNRAIADRLRLPYGTIGYWLHRDREAGYLDPIDRGDDRTCPRCASEPGPPENEGRYSYLLGQYLGDGHIVVTAKTAILRIYCTTAYPDIMDECERALLAVMARKVHRAVKVGCTGVCAYSKHWPCLFPQHGKGMKHTRPIVLRDWQRELVERRPKPFLRGLIHSDGCRVINHTVKRGKRYEYPRYHFTNTSQDVKDLFTWACGLIGVECRRNTFKDLSVARRASVAILDSFIGPKS